MAKYISEAVSVSLKAVAGSARILFISLNYLAVMFQHSQDTKLTSDFYECESSSGKKSPFLAVKRPNPIQSRRENENPFLSHFFKYVM